MLSVLKINQPLVSRLIIPALQAPSTLEWTVIDRYADMGFHFLPLMSWLVLKMYSVSDLLAFYLIILGFPDGSAGKQSACNTGDLGSIPGWGRSPGEGNGYPLQCSGLENSMICIDRGVTKSQTQLSDFHSFSLSHLINRNSGEFQRACSE